MYGQDRGPPELLYTDPDGVNVPANAWAGIAAILLSSGRTIHHLLSFLYPSFTQAHAVSLPTRNMQIISGQSLCSSWMKHQWCLFMY